MLLDTLFFILSQGISKGTPEITHGASTPMQKHHKKLINYTFHQ